MVEAQFLYIHSIYCVIHSVYIYTIHSAASIMHIRQCKVHRACHRVAKCKMFYMEQVFPKTKTVCILLTRATFQYFYKDIFALISVTFCNSDIQSRYCTVAEEHSSTGGRGLCLLEAQASSYISRLLPLLYYLLYLLHLPYITS